MFGPLPGVALDHLRQFVTACAGVARVLSDWVWSEDDRETRGLKLLKEWLSPEQRAQYDAFRYFDVTGCDTGTRYRIHYGAAMNIHEIDRAGRARVGWCFVPNAYLVAGDVMLAQKIALETDERGALAVAKTFIPTETQPHLFVHP
jgi:hypothetical protein